MAITHTEIMQTLYVVHVRREYKWVLVLLVGVPWYITYSCSKSKLSDYILSLFHMRFFWIMRKCCTWFFYHLTLSGLIFWIDPSFFTNSLLNLLVGRLWSRFIFLLVLFFGSLWWSWGSVRFQILIRLNLLSNYLLYIFISRTWILGLR